MNETISENSICTFNKSLTLMISKVKLEFLVPNKDIMLMKNCSITVTCKEIKPFKVSC